MFNHSMILASKCHVLKQSSIKAIGPRRLRSLYFLIKKYLLNRDVQYAASSQKVLDLICGIQVNGCSPKALAEYLGNNPLSPFIFDVNISDTDYITNENILIKPINTTLNQCYNNVNMPFFKAAACGCADCFKSCPVPIIPPALKVCKVMSLDCVDFVCIVLFSVLSCSFLTVILVVSCLSRRTKSGVVNKG